MSAVGRATVTIQLASGGWAVQSMDTIRIDGWCRPGPADGGTRQPRRIISMTMADTGGPALDDNAFEGHDPLGLARLFLLRESPDIWFPVE